MCLKTAMILIFHLYLICKFLSRRLVQGRKKEIAVEMKKNGKIRFVLQAITSLKFCEKSFTVTLTTCKRKYL